MRKRQKALQHTALQKSQAPKHIKVAEVAKVNVAKNITTSSAGGGFC